MYSRTYSDATNIRACPFFHLGVNFADGRIKGYPTGLGRRGPGRNKGYCVFLVRGNPQYGKNEFVDNRDGTITDRATGLTWAKVDSGHLRAGNRRDGKMNWAEALAWVESLEYGGHSDWRLPNAKELQSIVDYKRSPDTTRSAAIDPILHATVIRDPQGKTNHASYWSSTTHKRKGNGSVACYVAFGRSQGWMQQFGGTVQLLDVHGAGSQRSDPKAGDPAQFLRGRGPQGDVIAIYNLVRPVRGGDVTLCEKGPDLEPAVTERGRRERAQPAPPGFVERLDRNGDGKVSRSEFDGPPDAFDRHDTNRDGFLDESESPMRQGMGPPMPPPRRGKVHGRGQ